MKIVQNPIKKLFNLIVFFFLLFTLSTTVVAQDIIVKVKKGTAKLGSQTLTENSPSTIIKNTEVLNIQSGALIIVRQDVIIVELPANKNYLYADIQALIKKKKQASTGGFTAIAFKDPIQKRNSTPLKGSSVRATEEDNKPDFYYPYDNMLVYDSHIVFSIGGAKTSITSKVILKNTKTNEIFFDAIPTGNTFKIANLPEGAYEWTYSIKFHNTTKEVLDEDFKNTFLVPSDAEKKELATKVEAFKKELKGFSREMQKLLLLEYCVESGIYCKL